MKVVEKIESFEYNTAINYYENVKNYSMRIAATNIPLSADTPYIYVKKKTRLEAVYTAVIDFINWYNQNKQDG